MAEIGRNYFDQLKGYRVIVRFNKLAKTIKKISNTGRHRGFRSHFEGNVECILDLPIKLRTRKL